MSETATYQAIEACGGDMRGAALEAALNRHDHDGKRTV
jgi:hypothetical protein